MNRYPGMSYGSEAKYKRLGPKAEYRNTKTVFAGPGNNVNTDASLHFRVLLGDSEWGRLKNQPFWMRLQAKYPNPSYDANKVGEDAASKKARTKDLFLQPSANLPAVYLPPSSGGGIFFERADVYLDGQDISKDVEVSNLQFVYQYYNRTFSNAAQRARLGQEVNITCSKDVASLTTQSEKYKKAIQPLQNVSYSSATTLYLEFSLDGLPFLSAPRNHALCSLQKQTENDNPMLPPGSCLEITLHKRMPPYIGLEWSGISSGTYFSNDPDATSAMKDNIEFTIEAVGLCYESLVMSENERIARDLQQGTLSTFFDVPKISYQAVLANQQHINMSVLIPAGTKIGYVGFVYGHQLWQNQTSKKNITAKTKFPDSLRKVTFSIAGHETVGFRRGFEGLGQDLGYSSESCRNYFNDLRADGILDDVELEEMFPRDPGKRSFIQILMLDLRPYRIKKNTTLYVECEFSADLSPEQTNLLTIMVRELSLYKARGFWHTKFTDGE